MDNKIEISLERVRAVILELDQNSFSTADVIRGYCGGFFSNSGTPAYYSLNAQFGKLLERNRYDLRIEQSEANVRIVDDRSPPVATSSSFWRRTHG